ncbi:MGMT family protein, partial [Acinetobacter baumannii]|nr:MGMT family protein [Acinetobacter baumannii]
LCDIPYGQTRSYSDIAQQIQKPTAVRAIGRAIGANPILITVPCHRVIGKNGSLTGYRGGMEMKTQLLELERGFTNSGKELQHV